MLMHMLFTPGLPDVPDNVEVVQDFGFTEIVDDNGKRLAHGNHLYLRGEEEAIRQWLKDVPGFWNGVGAPFMQQFKVCHIKQ